MADRTRNRVSTVDNVDVRAFLANTPQVSLTVVFVTVVIATLLSSVFVITVVIIYVVVVVTTDMSTVSLRT